MMSANLEGPSEELVLAAIDRAIMQSARPISAASDRAIADHLTLGRRSGAWRQARRRLRELQDAGEVEQGSRKGITVWAITPAGRKHLERAVAAGGRPALPESPQRRLWCDSRRLATQEADRFRAELSTALNEGLLLLGDDATPSQAWLALSVRLAQAAERVAAVVFCRDEWPEPQEEAPTRARGRRCDAVRASASRSDRVVDAACEHASATEPASRISTLHVQAFPHRLREADRRR